MQTTVQCKKDKFMRWKFKSYFISYHFKKNLNFKVYGFSLNYFSGESKVFDMVFRFAKKSISIQFGKKYYEKQN